MREILFKAKRIDNGEWIEGYYVHADETLCKSDVHVIFNGYDLSVAAENEVDPETICQYTGLTDRNGVKIFEGDFVNVRTTAYMFRSCVVKWNESNAMWSVASGVARYRMSDSFKYEVIGNIHDEEEDHGKQ